MPVRKLREGKRVVGTMVRMIKDPAVAWMAHHAGLGYIMLDLEHGSYTLETVGNIFKVGRALGLGCFARVPELSRGYVSRIMDAGATGVMVPMLESVEAGAATRGLVEIRTARRPGVRHHRRPHKLRGSRHGIHGTEQ